MAAGASVFIEKGYDAATMTEIAAQAGASIGSLYQFFPSKTLLAEAIHLEALDQLASEMAALKHTIEPGESVGSIADALIGLLLGFMERHPAFIVMAERRDVDRARKVRTRQAMREQIAELLAQATPRPAPERLQNLAVLVLAVMRSAISLLAERALPGRDIVLAELRTMLYQHLNSKN